MTLYLDASALVKRYLDEPGSEVIGPAMEDESDWASSQVTLVETLRAVADDGCGKQMRSDWEEFFVVRIDEPLCELAVTLAIRHLLKTLDVIHLASAVVLATDDLTFATWDRRLHAAAQAEGLATLPVSLS